MVKTGSRAVDATLAVTLVALTLGGCGGSPEGVDASHAELDARTFDTIPSDTPELDVSLGADGGMASASSRIAVGDAFVCVVDDDGRVRCCGANLERQLGRNTGGEHRNEPDFVTGVEEAVSISAGRAHACVVLRNGTVRCWGADNSGQRAGSGLTGAFEVEAGREFTLARTASATYFWGTISGTTSALSATMVFGGASESVAGGGYSACAVVRGRVQCFGDNRHGELGSGAPMMNGIMSPVEVPGIDSAVEVAAGYWHTCARMADGTVWCWGSNGQGQLGNGSMTSSAEPVAVAGLSEATRLALGDWSSCALRRDGSVWCWGNGTPSAAPFGGLEDVVDIAASVPTTGQSVTCVRRSDESVWCWGYSGVCAGGSMTPRLPIRLPF